MTNDAMNAQLEEHLKVVASAQRQLPLLQQIAGHLIECFTNGGTLFLCGNGGSAADAQHIAAELVGRYRVDRKALPAISLTTDTSILTAVSNDLGADQCFSRQVEAMMTPRDTLWILSTSGRSPNVLRAADAARKIGATVLGFTGRSGGLLKDLCQLCFQVEHDRTDRIQEVHQLAYHLVCENVEAHFGAAAPGMKNQR